jgi:hypothetical protein
MRTRRVREQQVRSSDPHIARADRSWRQRALKKVGGERPFANTYSSTTFHLIVGGLTNLPGQSHGVIGVMQSKDELEVGSEFGTHVNRDTHTTCSNILSSPELIV